MRTFKALIKREFWEHKGAMAITPAALTVFFAALSIIGLITASNLEINGDDFSLLNKMPAISSPVLFGVRPDTASTSFSFTSSISFLAFSSVTDKPISF